MKYFVVPHDHRGGCYDCKSEGLLKFLGSIGEQDAGADNCFPNRLLTTAPFSLNEISVV